MVEQLLHACMPIILPEGTHGATHVFAAAVASLGADDTCIEQSEVGAYLALLRT